jgi:hypothetical protein
VIAIIINKKFTNYLIFHLCIHVYFTILIFRMIFYLFVLILIRARFQNFRGDFYFFTINFLSNLTTNYCGILHVFLKNNSSSSFSSTHEEFLKYFLNFSYERWQPQKFWRCYLGRVLYVMFCTVCSSANNLYWKWKVGECTLVLVWFLLYRDPETDNVLIVTDNISQLTSFSLNKNIKIVIISWNKPLHFLISIFIIKFWTQNIMCT